MKIKLYFLKINIIPENTTVTLYMPKKVGMRLKHTIGISW